MDKIKVRAGKNGMVRVIVGDIEFEANPTLVLPGNEESLRIVIAGEREFREWERRELM